jgi:nucleoside-triphosphatase THEP1
MPRRASQVEIPDVPRAPWSEIGDDFLRDWGRPGGKVEPEHIEVLGPSGSGKSYFVACILLARARGRQSHIVFIATKPADRTILKMGWPIVKDWRGVNQNPQCIFWPRTGAIGARRKAYQEQRIRDLLDRLWEPESNTVIVFDEIAYIQKLSRDLADTIDMYLREARSSGITLVMGKQRPQGVTREMHAETTWVISFKPRDRNDAERTAELFGSKREWTPILESLDNTKHEFLIQNRRTGVTFISWIDVPLKPQDRNSVARAA